MANPVGPWCDLVIRVLIIEDEPPAHRRLRRLVLATPGYEGAHVAVAESVREALTLLDGGVWDVVLLDLDLSGRDGFDLVGRFPSSSPTQVIVVSAYAQRAIEAFEHSVVDFVRKPVAAARLAQALTRVRRNAPPVGGPSLVVRRRGHVELVPLDDVVCFSGADDYVEVSLVDGRRVLHDSTLDVLEEKWPETFVRVHRSHLANLKHVVRLRTRENEERVAELVGGAAVPVSRRRYGTVEDKLRDVRGLPAF